MNEWSYKGFNSGSVTADQQLQTKAYRQNWEENWNHIRANTNLKNTMNCYAARDYNKSGVYAEQQQYYSDSVKVPSGYFSKRKKYGASDPRFKRLINSEMRNETCFESEQDKISPLSKKSQILDERINDDSVISDKMISYLKTPNESSNGYPKKFGSPKQNCQRNLSEEVTRDVGFKNSAYANDNPPDESYRDSDKIRITSKTNLKKSASDCTLHLKNNYGNELEEENLNRMRQHPSATRINKIHHWMKESRVAPEKRRSVITVIGQTQSKSFSKILHEINQRRKLAKELDKHALCEAIMESAENQCKVKNLIAKVDFLLPDGKVIYSTEKVYMCKENDNKCVEKDFGEYENKNSELLENTEKLRKRCEMIPERDSSISQVGKKSKTKRSYRKLGMSVKEKNFLKDKVKSFYLGSSSMLFWSFLILLFLTMCACAFCYSFKSYHFILPEFLRPKGRAWYKKFFT